MLYGPFHYHHFPETEAESARVRSSTKESLFHILVFMSHGNSIIAHMEMCLEVIALHEMSDNFNIESKV